MSEFTYLKTTKDFTDFMAKLYFPPTDKVEEIKIPKIRVISILGKGAPGSTDFQQAISALYGIAYGLKMGFKFGKIDQPRGYFDFKVPPLEGLWWQKGEIDMKTPEKWQWKVMIMLPAFVKPATFEIAQKQAAKKHPEIPYQVVRLEDFEEGQSVQLTHLGPYAEEAKTISKLIEYAKLHGYEVSGKHHEIYLNDPRRVVPAKIKTVLRYPVKK